MIDTLLVFALQGVPPEIRDPATRCLTEQRETAVAACELALAPESLAATRRAQLLRAYARQLSALERWLEAAEVYREWARLAPENGEAHRRLGAALLLGLGRPEDALGPIDAALRLAPTDAEAHGLRGMALNAVGRHSDAVRAFEDALAADPGYFAAHPGAREVFDAAIASRDWPRPDESARP